MQPTPPPALWGNNPAMKQVRKLIARAAPTDATVMLEGETGTGKELAARILHAQSQRAGKAFVPVNCASIPPTLLESEFFGHKRGSFTNALTAHRGVFEAAHQGTLFLDEVAELSMRAQACLLRVLDDQVVTPVGSRKLTQVNVRIISATNQDLAKLVEQGQFRADLYQRLHVVNIRLPALREHADDIPLLTSMFLERAARELARSVKIASDSMQVMTCYSWPGNVRELQNTIQSAVVLCSRRVIHVRDLPAHTRQPVAKQDESLRFTDVQEQLVHRALERANGRKGAAAQLLGCSRKTLWRMLRNNGA